MIHLPQSTHSLGTALLLVAGVLGAVGLLIFSLNAPAPPISIVLISSSVVVGVWGGRLFLPSRFRRWGLGVSVALTLWSVLVTALMVTQIVGYS